MLFLPSAQEVFASGRVRVHEPECCRAPYFCSLTFRRAVRYLARSAQPHSHYSAADWRWVVSDSSDPVTEGPEPPQVEQVLTRSMGRRQFMVRAAALGLTGVPLAAFLSACARTSAAPIAAQSATPTPATTPWSAPSTPSPVPTATPTPTLTRAPLSNLAKTAHLLRRAGFGSAPGEIQRFDAMGLPAATDYLLNYEQVDDTSTETAVNALGLQPDQRLRDLQAWWLARMVLTQRPLQEKMVLFWHGHLTSSVTKAPRGPAMRVQNELFRGMAMGRYPDLLKAVSRDPAMMYWLDTRLNKKGVANEYYSREFMELFTLGVGQYTETDVRQAARAFTGWEVRNGAFFFNANEHDFGSKTYLGRTGDWNGDDIVDIDQDQPVAAEFITRKLFEFFVYENPAPQIITQLAQVFRENNGEIKPVVQAILTSDEFYSPQAFQAKIKSPAEIVAGGVRALGIPPAAVRQLPAYADAMGQSLFDPPNVAGWPGGTAWINSDTLLQRANFANYLATLRNQAAGNWLAGLVYRGQPYSAQQQVQSLANSVLGGTLPQSEISLLTDFLETLEAAPGAPASSAERLRPVVYLLLASPDFQLA